MKSGGGFTLCIPTIFVSYTGEALDYKAPLLKAIHQLDLAATAVCKYFDNKVNRVTATLGIEQEYFLIDAALYNARPDLLISGRTLFGHLPAKGQQLDDHYFGSIPERVQAFMIDFENEALKLGIPLKTRHNEVAPSQFECAPNFEELNLAVDHNQLLMDVIDKTARRHNFRSILHEKPFANVNGSGKHCNFSMGTDTGENLLSPGKTPNKNFRFLAFFVNVIKAVYDHADLLRASIASASNDHRLGANEAPPAIISVFVGNQLYKVMQSLKNNKLEHFEDDAEGWIAINAPQIPNLTKDNTDRNRTSPFAFTGNKFEFRAVGSSQNTSAPMTVLTTAVARQLVQFKNDVDHRTAQGENLSQAIVDVLQGYITVSEPILFEGNNYSEEWAQEAAKRGLSNKKTTPTALDAYVSDKSLSLFKDLGIMGHIELHARHEIMLETYVHKVQIESRIMGELAMTHVVPAAIRHLNELIDSLSKLKNLGLQANTQAMEESVIEISNHITAIKTNVRNMVDARKGANKLDDMREKAIAYCEEVKPYFNVVRYHSDKLEILIDDSYWPLPKYRELLFLR
jgi:glutamine synthetase